MRGKLELQKVKGAYEICNLKQPVARGFHFCGEFNLAVQVCLEHLMKKPCDGGLSAVVVYLDAAYGRKCIMACGDELGERHLEPVDNLVRGIDIAFVDGKTMVFVVDLSGKSHHAGEYSSAQLAAQHGVVLLPANERTGVKAMPFQTDFGIRAFKVGNFGGYVTGLVVEDHAENIESTFGIWETEVSRLVDENTKYFCFHANPAKKREWRDANLATHAESFPRIPVTPTARRRSKIILANRRAWRKGGAK